MNLPPFYPMNSVNVTDFFLRAETQTRQSAQDVRIHNFYRPMKKDR